MESLSKGCGLIVAGLIGLNGALLMTGLLVSEGGAPGMAERTVLVTSAFFGAFLAGGAVLLFFGQDSAGGWVVAAIGAILATGLGGAVGGGLFILAIIVMEGGQGGIGSSEVMQVLMLCVMVVFMALGNPKIFAIWALLMALTHLVARRLRSPA